MFADLEGSFPQVRMTDYLLRCQVIEGFAVGQVAYHH
jgi:hypothetical protein